MSLVAGFLTCGMPHLAHRMADQLKGFPRVVCLDNGGDPPVGDDLQVDYVFRSEVNTLWSPGVNLLISMARKAYPDATAVWACNDDIEGVDEEMALGMYAAMRTYNLGVVSPYIHGSFTERIRARSEDRIVAARDYIDFTAPMIDLNTWDKVGPLDEQFKGWGADIDWCHRARELGVWLAMDDRFAIDHRHHSQTCEAKKTMVAHSQDEWEKRFWEKWKTDPWALAQT